MTLDQPVPPASPMPDASQTWSAYVDVVSPDGQRALIVRVSHDPAADRAELWVHAFLDGRLYAHMSAHPCPPLSSSLTGDAHQQVHLDLARGQLKARVLARQTDRCVFNDGHMPLVVSLQWQTEGQQGSNLRGRDERLVRVAAEVSIDGQLAELAGWGHQHTQLQAQPRFSAPFTYLSLRGDTVGFVGLLTRAARRGFGTRQGAPLKASEVRLDAPAGLRQMLIETTEGTLEGTLVRTYQYWIPMGGRWRDGSIVAGTLDGCPVSGVINDYEGPAPRAPLGSP